LFSERRAPRFKDVRGVSALNVQVRRHRLSHILRKREDAISVGFPATDLQAPTPPIDVCKCDVGDLLGTERIEKEKLAITTRHRVLATILQRVSAPLKKADLLAVAHYLIGHLSYSQVPALAKRHKVEAKKNSASAQELLAKQVGRYDEAELCKLLLEISLLDSAYQRSTASRDDVLTEAARRYRVDAEKLQEAVSAELAAKRDKKTKVKAKTNDRHAI
jgi:hypothetical protein